MVLSFVPSKGSHSISDPSIGESDLVGMAFDTFTTRRSVRHGVGRHFTPFKHSVLCCLGILHLLLTPTSCSGSVESRARETIFPFTRLSLALQPIDDPR